MYQRLSIKITLVSVFAALSIGVSYVLAPLINIELMSVLLFIAGFLYGKYIGVFVGLISSIIYYGWNPFGVPPIPLYLVCVSLMAFVGFIGGLVKKSKPSITKIKIKRLIDVGIAVSAVGVGLILLGYFFSLIPALQVFPGREYLWPMFYNTFYIIGIILIPVGIPISIIGIINRKKLSEEYLQIANLKNILKLASIGLLYTFIFEMLTTVVFAYLYYNGNIMIAFAVGFPFTLIHLIFNTIIFAALVLPIHDAVASI